jgi:hypothetical protein
MMREGGVTDDCDAVSNVSIDRRPSSREEGPRGRIRRGLHLDEPPTSLPDPSPDEEAYDESSFWCGLPVQSSRASKVHDESFFRYDGRLPPSSPPCRALTWADPARHVDEL